MRVKHNRQLPFMALLRPENHRPRCIVLKWHLNISLLNVVRRLVLLYSLQFLARFCVPLLIQRGFHLVRGRVDKGLAVPVKARRYGWRFLLLVFSLNQNWINNDNYYLMMSIEIDQV